MVSARPVSAVVAVAFVAGLVVGAAAVLLVQPAGEPGIDPAHPQYSVTTATGCVGPADGWATVMPTDRGQTVFVNLTVGHGPAESVETNLTYRDDGRYRFDVTTVPTEKGGSPDCPTGSTVQLWGTFPDSFDSVTVAVDGETVGTVRRAEHAPTYQSLSAA